MIIDTNVDLFRWPFRRIAGDEPAELVALLRKKGVTQAWAGTYEGLLHRDVAGVNLRLAAACKLHGPNFLVPFGTVNPKEPDWQEDLRRCQELHKMPGIRIYPSYHGYGLDDPLAAELFSLVAKRKMLLQIGLCMEDPRVQFPLMKVPPTDPGPLVDLAKQNPTLKIEALNVGYWGGPRTSHMEEVGKLENVYFDIAYREGVGGVAKFITETAPNRVMFGSHFPFFYWESAFLKVREAGLAPDQEKAVLEGNARAFLKG
jgi:predicted TIM-barrel fold metal-dependent hydrolase